MSEEAGSREGLSGVVGNVRKRLFCCFELFFCLNLLFVYKTQEFCEKNFFDAGPCSLLLE